MSMKSKVLLSVAVLGLALPLGLPVSVSADTTADSASTTKSASVDVTGGSLAFTKDSNGSQEAPSFNFGAKVSANSQSGIAATGYDNTKDTTDKYAGSELSVDDESGTGNGWQVTAKLGAFSDSASHNLTGAVLHMKSDTSEATGVTIPTADLTAGDAAQPIFTAAKDAGLGTSTADYKGTTLDIPSAEYAGTYTADLTYTLTSGPTA